MEEKVKKSKKAIYMKIASLVIAIVLISICLFVVLNSNKTMDMNFGFKNPDIIRIHLSNNSSVISFEKTDKEYQKIIDLYNKSFSIKQSELKSQGINSFDITTREDYKSLSSSSDSFVEFFYKDEQTIMLNGKEYQTNKTNKYFSIYIELKNSSEATQTTAYFKNLSSNSSNISFSSYAVQNELYSYLEKL